MSTFDRRALNKWYVNF